MVRFSIVNWSIFHLTNTSRFSKYNVLACQGCLYWVEYCLSVWKVLYDNSIPKEVIAYYEAYMNDVSIVKYTASYMWKYNAEDGRFVLIKEESIMMKLEEARKRRIDAMKSFRTNEDLKEKILDGILQVLDYRTHVNAFDPVEIIFKGDFKPSHITRNYVWIGYSFLSYQYGEHKIGIYFGNCIESLRW